MLMQHDTTTSKTFGVSISRSSFESITMVSYSIPPNNVVRSWDVSEKQNGSVKAWYIDEDSNNIFPITKEKQNLISQRKMDQVSRMNFLL